MMKFTATVSTALGSVSQMCPAGFGVVSNPPWSPDGLYTQHLAIAEITLPEAQNGSYTLSTTAAPAEMQSTTADNMKHNGGVLVGRRYFDQPE